MKLLSFIGSLLAATLLFSCAYAPAMAAEPATTVALDFDFIAWLTAAWSGLPWPLLIIAILWALVPLFSLIVSLTPTPTDDAWWGRWIYPALEKLALVFLKAKQKPGDDLIKPYDPWK